MEIDWITTLAQAVNFLVLVWLLQRFLYGPITRTIERRRETVQGRLDAADAKRAEADAAERTFREKEAALDAERAALLEAARADADALRRTLTAEVKAAIEDEREDWRRGLQAEREAFLEEFERKLGAYVTETVRHILDDLADADLEAQLAKRFAAELQSAASEALDAAKSEAADAGHVWIEGAHALDAPAQRRLTRLIHETLGDAIKVEYATDPDLLLGLRLRVGSQTLEWSLAGLLDDLDATFEQLIDPGEGTKRRSAREAA